jgi:hypothetical protein
LHADLERALAPAIAKARQATAPTPLFEVLPSVLDLGSLEYVSRGSAPEAKQLLADLGTQALRLGNEEVSRRRRRVDQLDDLAGSPARFDPAGGGATARRGLRADEERELDDAIAGLRSIEQTARKVRVGARRLGASGDRWEPLIADAADLADRGRALRDVVAN